MALFASGILDDLESKLRGFHASDNATFGTPRQTERRAGSSLEEKLSETARLAQRLVSKGRRDDVVALLRRYRAAAPPPTLLGSVSDAARLLDLVETDYQRVIDGEAELGDPPAHGDEIAEVRYYTLKNVMTQRKIWPALVDDIAKRSGIQLSED